MRNPNDVNGQIEAARTRLAEEARKANLQFEVILGSIPNGIVVQKPDGTLLYANDEAARTMSFTSAEELLSAPAGEVMSRYQVIDEEGNAVPPERLPGSIALRGQQAPQATLRYRTPATGEERWAIVKATPVFDEAGAVQFAVNVYQDITERKRAEEVQRFLAEATGVLASSLDYESTLARVAQLAVPRIADWCTVDLLAENGSMERLAIAHTDPDRVRLAEDLYRRFPPRPEEPAGVYRVLRTGGPEVYPEIPDHVLVAAARSDEHLRILREMGLRSAMFVPLVARGRILGVISLVSAESGRRFGPPDLELAQHLARRSALAVENARLYREAQEAVQIRNQFFSSLSHDLKNPLTGIMGHAQLLRRLAQRMEGPDAQRLIEGLGRIDDAATRMADQINELVDLARLQVGRPVDLNRAPTDLVALVRDVAAQHQHGRERHRIRVETTIEHLVGEWDPVRLGRALSNLIANAVKYSPQGGDVEISVDKEDGDTGTWAVVAVTDHGVGIPAEDLPRIFQGYHRATNVVGRFSGTGIGLSSARQMVEAHYGTIAVDSREGAGSTFTMRLPLRPPANGAGNSVATEPGMDSRASEVANHINEQGVSK